MRDNSMKEVWSAFSVHVSKYLGVALVAGSIVHAGALGGSTIKYIILVIVGIALTVYGNILENKIHNVKLNKKFILLAIILSFGTGMLSGGIQHFADSPSYGAILLGLGFFVTFVSFGYTGFKSKMKKSVIIQALVISVLLYGALILVAAPVVEYFNSLNAGHAELTEDHHS